MADLIIRGMEMPQGCEDCKLRYRHQGAYCVDYCFPLHKTVDPWTFGQDRNGDKPDWCPLLPLPEGHGRLVDASVAEGKIKEMYMTMVNSRSEGSTEVAFGLHLAASIIRTDTNVPTIVPAEGGSDGK